ncbi:MAG: ribonuclease HII [Thiotrichales bacterium]|nr:ribonuclease HII [Thiotrichales bacterium]
MVEQIELFSSNTARWVVGVDEVGRGPLVGEVVAAAVILPSSCSLPLADSKQLSEKKRNQLYPQILEQAVAYSIAVATPQEIDELNILQATLLAMRRAVSAIAAQHPIDLVLVDGNRCPKLDYPCQAIVKGDQSVPSISAASILAKVYRDQKMMELDQQYPLYGFAQHKGYPTAEHLQRLAHLPILPDYRRSFKPVQQRLQVLNASAMET